MIFFKTIFGKIYIFQALNHEEDNDDDHHHNSPSRAGSQVGPHEH